jgi:hypothetical protein
MPHKYHLALALHFRFCVISKQGFTQSDLPNLICNETSIRMRMTKQRPFLEAQNFHHKLQNLLEAIIGCKSHQKHVGVMITFNMIDVHIIVLQPLMVL